MTMRDLLAAGFALVLVPVSHAQDRDGKTLEEWQRIKCSRYQRAYHDATARIGLAGLGTDFLERHRQFLAGNCMERTNVCPRSSEEFRMANALVILGMNQGLASTFFPFACPK